MKGFLSLLLLFCLALPGTAEALPPAQAAGSVAAAGAIRYAQYSQAMAAPGAVPIVCEYDQLKNQSWGSFTEKDDGL